MIIIIIITLMNFIIINIFHYIKIKLNSIIFFQVVDLAEGHVAALKYVQNSNVPAGKVSTVLTQINKYELFY